jgi:hypothetical protein
MRALRLHLCLFILLGAAGVASAQGAGRLVVPGVPPLYLRFEDAGGRSPCPALGATPAAAAVECWSAQVDRAVSKRSSRPASQPSLACVSAWEITPAGQGACPDDAAQCVRPDTGLFERPSRSLPIDSNIQAASALSADLAWEYTAFQVLRNGYALNPHRPRIAGLALSQGLLVLHRAHALAAVKQKLEAGGCATEHLLPYFDLAQRVTEEVGRSDVPAILESHPPMGREWARRFHRVQLAVIGADGAVRPDGKWREDCEKASALGPRVGRLDADVNVWCGYAYEQLEMFDAALEHWHLARRSANHPEAAAYADRHLARARAVEPDGDVLADGGGE